MARIGRGTARQGYLGRSIFRDQRNALVKVIAGGAIPAIGIAAPVVILDVPTQQNQTVTVQCVAKYRRAVERNTFPRQGWDGDWVKGQGPAATSVAGVPERLVGVDPPAIIAALPTQGQQTVLVKLTAQYRRASDKQRFPLQGWDGDWVQGQGPAATSKAGVPERLLGPLPPQVIAPLPTQGQQTVAVKQPPRNRYHPARATHSKLPQVVVQVASPPVFSAPINKTVRTRPRPTHSFLRNPNTGDLLNFGHVQVVVPPRFRKGTGQLNPPTVLSSIPITAPPPPPPPPPADPVVTSLTVKAVAVTARAAFVRHAPHSVLRAPAEQDFLNFGRVQVVTPPRFRKGSVELSPPMVVSSLPIVPVVVVPPPPAAPVVTTLLHGGRPYAHTRDTFWRRWVEHILFSPSEVTPQAAAAPVLYPITTKLAGRTRREIARFRAISKLGRPSTLTPTISAVAPVLATHRAAQNIRVRQVPRSRLAPPAVIATTPTAQFGTTQVYLAAQHRLQQRRRTAGKLQPPTILQEPPLLGSDPRLNIRVVSAVQRRLQRRAAKSTLYPPILATTAVALTQQQQTITVLLATRARDALKRHVTRSTLRQPAQLQVFTGPSVTFASRTRRELVRHASHYKFITPTVVLPLPGLAAQTIKTRLAAVAQRLTRVRRGTHVQVFPPTVLRPHVTYTISVTTTGLRLARLEAVVCVNRAVVTDPPGTLTMTGDAPGTLGTLPADAPGTQTMTPESPGFKVLNPDNPADLGYGDPNCGC